jgi:RimJ/RimL family protein N-acetyltransferase
MLEQVRWYHGSIDNSRTHRFIIEHKDTHARLGLTGLWDIDWKDRLARTGIVLSSHSSVRRQGFGTDTYMTVIRYAFDELGLHRLESDIIEYNEASAALLVKKCCWHVEGTRRQSAFRGGRFWDRGYVSILADEYEAWVARTCYWEQ